MAAPRPRHRRGVLPVESEDAFLRKTLMFAGYHGWLAYHTHRSDRSPAGFVDLVMTRGPRLVFAELKRENGGRRATVKDIAERADWLQHRDITNHQATWLQALREVADANTTVEAYVWRPSDWPTIETVLRRIYPA